MLGNDDTLVARQRASQSSASAPAAELASTASVPASGAVTSVPLSIKVALFAFCEIEGMGVASALRGTTRLVVVEMPVAHATLASCPDVAVIDGDRCKPAAALRVLRSAPAIGLVVLAEGAQRTRRFVQVVSNVICLPKTISARDLSRAVQFAADPRSRTLVLPPETAFIIPGFSEREMQVLGLIVEGLTHDEIAARLHISIHTAKTHSRNIREKAGVRSNRSLIRWFASFRAPNTGG